jgi:hypothetical protein
MDTISSVMTSRERKRISPNKIPQKPQDIGHEVCFGFSLECPKHLCLRYFQSPNELENYRPQRTNGTRLAILYI